jgi:hypothetical protein
MSGSYVFSVVQSARQPPVPGTLPSLPSAGPFRMLQLHEGIWIVSAPVSLRDYSKEAIERCLQDLDCVSVRAVAHEAAVAFYFKRGPVIPLKLFTIFSTDDRAVGHLRRRLAHIRRLFDLVRDREEWGVRVTIEPDEPPSAPPARIASGRDYLKAKKQHRQHSGRATGAARKEAGAALASLGRLAARTKRPTPPAAAGGGRPTVLEAAFLVPSRRSTAWKARANAVGVRLAKRGCRLEITGPWPPYNFVSARPS